MTLLTPLCATARAHTTETLWCFARFTYNPSPEGLPSWKGELWIRMARSGLVLLQREGCSASLMQPARRETKSRCVLLFWSSLGCWNQLCGQQWNVGVGENAAGQQPQGSAPASSSASPWHTSDWDGKEFSISHCCIPDHLFWPCAYVVNSPAPLCSQL